MRLLKEMGRFYKEVAPMAIAAVYIRVSTEDQTEFSPEAQLRAIGQYAEKNGYTIEEDFIFRDEGISGRRADKRPAFQKMVAMAKKKPAPFRVILVHKFDRFARSREDSIVYKSLLKRECNIKVVSITEQLEDDKFSVILEAMLEAMAEYYSLNLSEEVKKGMTEKARRGELQTPAPFGYRMVNGLLTPQPEEAEMVREIFRLYVNERLNLRSIAKHMNGQGCKTKQGNSFDTRSITYILCNPTYTGKMRWTPTGPAASRFHFDNPDTWVLEGKHPAIVGEQMWQEANRRIRADKKQKIPLYTRDGNVQTHWLRGVLRCGHCGTTLSYGKGAEGKQGAYRCSKYLTGGCPQPQRITVGKAEQAVLDVLQKDGAAVPPIVFQKNNTHLQEQQDTWMRCKKMITKLQDRLEKARELVLAGIDTTEEYRQNKLKIEQQMKETIEKMQTIEQQQKMQQEEREEKRVGSVADILLSQASLTEKNNAIRQLVSQMVYDKQNETLDIYYYAVET